MYDLRLSLFALFSFDLVVYPTPVNMPEKRKYLKTGMVMGLSTWLQPAIILQSWFSQSTAHNTNTQGCSFHPFHPPACSVAPKYLISCSAYFWSQVCSHLGKCTSIMEAAWSEAEAWLPHSVVLRPDKALCKRALENWWDDVWQY